MDEDMQKVHMRSKRLATKKKMEILNKEKLNKDTVLEVRQREKKMVDYRYRNRVQSIVSADAYHKSLDSWAKKGFHHSSLTKDDQELANSLDRGAASVKEWHKFYNSQVRK